MQSRLLDQEVVISKLADNPSSFATKLYSVKTQPNRNAFGPDLAKSSFKAFNDSELCKLVLEHITQNGSDILFEAGPSRNTFQVTIGDQTLQIKALPIPDPKDLSIQVDWSPVKTQKPKSSQQYTRFIASDSFTHTTLMGFILRFYLSKLAPGLNTVQLVYSASICSVPTAGIFGPRTRRFGVQLQDFCDLGTLTQVSRFNSFLEKRTINMLSPETNGLDRIKRDNMVEARVDSTFDVLVVKPEIIVGICKQVLTTLLILQRNLGFQHGKLVCSSIGLSSSLLRTSYGCVQFDDPFTCKLMNLDSAAISLNLNGTVHRMYQKSPVWGQWISQVLPDTDVQLIRFNTAQIDVFGQNVKDGQRPSLSQTIDHTQFEKYLKSELNVPEKQVPNFDVYTFMLSFLSIPEVFYSVFSDPKLKAALWSPLFLNLGEAGTVETQIKDGIDFGRGTSFEQVFRMIQGKSLSSLATFQILNNLVSLEEV